MFLNHLSDHNVANINIYDVAVSDIVHISTELRITAANHKNSVCTLDVLVQKTTELGVLSVPITRYTTELGVLAVLTTTGLEIRGILVANATMFSQLLPGFSYGSKHLLLP